MRATAIEGLEFTLRPGPPVMSTGAWFRNTLCAATGDSVILTTAIGNLDSPAACARHERSARALLGWLAERDAVPGAIAHDLHPDFHSTRVAHALATELGVDAWAVQHHHAHIAAVTAEHGHQGPVVGLAIDGVGLGTDGTAWGGELLRVDGHACTRIGGLRPLAMPGGDRAAREPWRMAAAVLHALGRTEEIPGRFSAHALAGAVARMLETGTRCVPTSSLGRVFDAAAALLGVCETQQSEAEAAIALEAAAARHGPLAPMPGGWRVTPDGALDLLPLMDALSRLEGADAAARGAALFHATVAAALVQWVVDAAHRSGIPTVAMGGGCLLNRILSGHLRDGCASAGLRVLEPRRLPPGDAAIAFGQAAVARSALRAAGRGWS